MKSDTDLTVDGYSMNVSTIKGVMMEAGASVRQVNEVLDHWPLDGDADMVKLSMTAAGMRRLQVKVILQTLGEVSSILDIAGGKGNDTWTPVIAGSVDKDPYPVGTGHVAEPGT